ncbi:hypothetical protein BH11BAC2_BH11BAC2_10720 [soil metagenome]
MKKILLYSLVLFAYSACKSPVKQETSDRPTGVYINKTLLDSIDGEKLISDLPRLCEEIRFISDDTLEMNDGFETSMVHYSNNGQNNFILDFSDKYQFPFSMDNENLLLKDTGYLHQANGSTFTKSEKGFIELVNEKIISGKYFLATGKTRDTIIFTNKGDIENWNSWKKYEICIAGDCTSMSEEPANIINLSNGEAGDFFVWKILSDSIKMALVLYPLSPELPDIKGERKILKDSLLLTRIK